jgi:hypothetical protein
MAKIPTHVGNIAFCLIGLWLQREFTCSYLSFSNMSSRKRVRWTGEQIKEAVDAVNGGMKIKPAALKYCVPRKTLSDYVRRGNTDKLRSGPLTVFTQQQERELVGHVKRLQQVGFPVSVTCVR